MWLVIIRLGFVDCVAILLNKVVYYDFCRFSLLLFKVLHFHRYVFKANSANFYMVSPPTKSSLLYNLIWKYIIIHATSSFLM